MKRLFLLFLIINTSFINASRFTKDHHETFWKEYCEYIPNPLKIHIINAALNKHVYDSLLNKLGLEKKESVELEKYWLVDWKNIKNDIIQYYIILLKEDELLDFAQVVYSKIPEQYKVIWHRLNMLIKPEKYIII